MLMLTMWLIARWVLDRFAPRVTPGFLLLPPTPETHPSWGKDLPPSSQRLKGLGHGRRAQPSQRLRHGLSLASLWGPACPPQGCPDSKQALGDLALAPAFHPPRVSSGEIAAWANHMGKVRLQSSCGSSTAPSGPFAHDHFSRDRSQLSCPLSQRHQQDTPHFAPGPSSGLPLSTSPGMLGVLVQLSFCLCVSPKCLVPQIPPAPHLFSASSLPLLPRLLQADALQHLPLPSLPSLPCTLSCLCVS